MYPTEYKYIVLVMKYFCGSLVAHKSELKYCLQNKSIPHYLLDVYTTSLAEDIQDRDCCRKANALLVPEVAL